MLRIFSQTRYIVLLPVIGLFLASAYLFFTGGFGLVIYLFESLSQRGLAPHPASDTTVTVMEYVEQFLTGTVLYIVAVGLYGLFIRQLNVPGWLRIESLNELKHTVIGVVVAVLAVKFMGIVVEWDQPNNLLEIGGAIGLVTAGLGIYMGLQSHGQSRSHVAPVEVATSGELIEEIVEEGGSRSITARPNEASTKQETASA
jgi:uncharacterized membrane protein YqhA